MVRICEKRFTFTIKVNYKGGAGRYPAGQIYEKKNYINKVGNLAFCHKLSILFICVQDLMIL